MLGSQGKVVRKDKFVDEKKRKQKLTQAIHKLKSDDKNKDIDTKMDQHASQTKSSTANLNLELPDFASNDHSSVDSTETEYVKQQLMTQKAPFEVPKTSAQGMSILAEAV